MSFSGLKNKHLDILMEISNIGAGHAATALSQLTENRVDIRVPRIAVIDIADLPGELGGADRTVVGMFLKMLGDATGGMLFVYSRESADRLISMLLHAEQRGDVVYSETELSALKEVGNILSSSYLSALGAMLNISLICSTPSVLYDMTRVIVDHALAELRHTEDKALLVETEFFISDSEVKGNFFLLPDAGSISVILNAAGHGR